MNFPIPVNLTVAQNNVPVNITVSDNSESIGLDIETQIVASVASEYEGPYTVTPSESAQILETDEKLMADNVTVGAIPDDYVGSAVPRRTKNDINITKIVMPGGVQKPVAIAAKGYYTSTTTKDIPTGTATTPATSITANPTVSVDSNGLVTASVSASQSVTPTVNEGYVSSGTAGTVSVSGEGTLQLSTQAAQTITPTESEQTAVAAQKYTTGEVKVGAIPSDYVGSSVPKQAGTTITPTESERTAVEPGKYTTGEVKVGAIPSNYVGSSVPTQAAQTITPTTTDQTIASGTYLTGAQTIEGVVCTNLTAENIAEGVVVKIGTATDDDSVASVTGTHSGGEDTLVKALCNQVTSVEDDTLTSIRSMGLAYMTALESVSFPALQTINQYAFYDDYNLIMNGWPFPAAKSIGNYAFRYCYGLTGDIVLPSTVTSIGQYSFANCDHMETFTATGAISTLGTYTFNGASGHVMALREIHMPNLGTGIALNLNFGSTTAANACQNLEICDIGKAKSIAANTFANCYKLQTLIMRRTSVTTCANVNAFLNTPLRGRNSLTAKIYVPSALIDTYKAASVWTTINGYGYVEWLPIEGSIYEL